MGDNCSLDFVLKKKHAFGHVLPHTRRIRRCASFCSHTHAHCILSFRNSLLLLLSLFFLLLAGASWGAAFGALFPTEAVAAAAAVVSVSFNQRHVCAPGAHHLRVFQPPFGGNGDIPQRGKRRSCRCSARVCFWVG